jgi:hypothetical protein
MEPMGGIPENPHMVCRGGRYTRTRENKFEEKLISHLKF